MQEEIFDIIDERGVVIGTATRDECHGNPALVHRAVHVLVFNSSGRLFLQKRSKAKRIQPGKWDTSVGGHLASGESYEEAALRETEEELGFEPDGLVYLFSFRVRNEIESEDINTYAVVYDGPITTHPEEIDEGKFWSMDEIAGELHTGALTPAFEREFGILGQTPLPFSFTE